LVVVLLGLGAGVGGWWLSSGRYSRVPDLARSTPATAQQVVQDAGFDFGGIAGSRYSETVPAGQVITTKPAAGSRHVHGTKIMLVLSLGKLRINVPDVRGMTVDEARAAITKQGLTVSPDVVHKHNPKVDKGKVINSLPHPDAPVKKNAPVTLYVSLGPPKVQVPTITKGTPYQDAVQALKDAHLEPVKGPSRYDDDAAQGTVVSVSPTGTVTEFSQITITVSKGPRMVTVPQIDRGSKTSDAEQQLQDLQLKVKIEPFFVFAGTGHVYAISPSPGTPVRVGSTVTITTY
jgi:beta-lactam-binding protein with PASTA domain